MSLMLKKSRGNIYFWSLFIISLVIYILISYFTLRHVTSVLFLLYILLFIAYLIFINISFSETRINQVYIFSILFRLALFALIPNLSDDVYRFIWDGRITANGLNPYVHLPEYFLSSPEYQDIGLTSHLYELFGKNTHSSYPPLNQLIFAIAAWIAPGSIFGSIVVIRLFIIVFEIGNIIIIRKLLKIYRKPDKTGLFYALNPLVILELTGNLHFEAILIFFILLTLWYLHFSKILSAGIVFSFGILSKLIPLIFLPVIWIRAGWKKGFLLVFIAGIFTVLGFLPFLQFYSMDGFFNSLSLYFNKLEFNASIYFIVRQIGYWITGYNIIQIAGPLLGVLTFLIIFTISLSAYARRNKLVEIWMWILMIYLAMTTTLHPWYITTLLALSIFTAYRFPVVWTFFIFTTYEGYTISGYSANYWFIGIEYLVVYGIMIWEIINITKFKKSPLASIYSFTILDKKRGCF